MKPFYDNARVETVEILEVADERSGGCVMEAPQDTCIPVRAEARVVKDVERVSEVRIYRSFSNGAGSTICLQVRTPQRVSGGKEGTAFIVASASLSVDDLRTLRNLIDGHLAAVEADERGEYTNGS